MFTNSVSYLSKLFLFSTSLLFLASTIQTKAQCSGKMGKLNPANEQIILCAGATVSIQLDTFHLEEGQVLYYLLTENKIDPLNLENLVIFAVSSNGTISGESHSGQNYWVTAAIGNEDSIGFIDLDNSCTLFSNSVEVVFLRNISIETIRLCNNGLAQGYYLTLEEAYQNTIETVFMK